MFLVAGTFFPLDELPTWAQVAGNVNPLYHCVELVRHAVFGFEGWADVGHLAFLVGFALVVLAAGDPLHGAQADPVTA